jgi:hypothetical protein
VKFGIGVILKSNKVLEQFDFYESRLSESYALLKGVSEFLPALSVFLDRIR